MKRVQRVGLGEPREEQLHNPWLEALFDQVGGPPCGRVAMLAEPADNQPHIIGAFQWQSRPPRPKTVRKFTQRPARRFQAQKDGRT